MDEKLVIMQDPQDFSEKNAQNELGKKRTR